MAMMKSSNTEWLGDIPAEWDVAQIGNYYELRNEKVSDYDFEPLSVTMKGIVPQLATAAKSDDHSNRKLVKKGDFVINSRSDRRGSCGISPLNGSVSLINIVMEPRGEMNPQYYNWLFHTEQFADEFYKWGHGIVDDLWTTRWQEMKKILIVAPSPDEQQAIADYLDETCSKIDEIIAEAKASIDEYKELKQSVIFEAVTKGLDKNVNVYKTGNSWIPSLPVGIKLSRFGLHHDIILGKMLCPNPRNEEDTLEPYYCAANVHFDGVTGVLKTMWFNSKEKETYVVHKNDMLIVEGGAGAGGAAIMNEEPPVSTFVQNSIMIVRSHMKDNRYSCYLVQALVKNKYVDVVCNKATIPHFTKEKVSYMPYPVFNRNERNEIANYLDERCKQIDSLIAEKESLINDLEAYKKSLIYEVVTGKRRVV